MKRLQSSWHGLSGRCAALLLALGAMSVPAAAGQVASAPQVTANELVRRVIAKEMKAMGAERGNWMYRLRRETPKGSQTKEMVDTREGIVARVVAINDRPLTAAERAADDKRIQGLLNNPAEQAKKAKEQRQESERVQKMLEAMPQAFLYEYDGTEPGPYGQMIRLAFKPNPNFKTTTRETLVFKHMTGNMWIDASDERLAKIDATLIEDATLGWGLVARLHKGGRFQVEQTKTAANQWMITRMRLDFTGKALLFKTITIKQVQTLGDFRKVPQGLSLAEGVNLLRQQPDVLAEKR